MATIKTLTSKYKFDINNSDYINALIAAVGDLPITDLQFPSSFGIKSIFLGDKPPMAVKALPELIEIIKNRSDFPKDTANFEINVDVTAASFAFLRNVMPKFQYQPVIKDPKLTDMVSVILDMVHFWTFNYTDIGYAGEHFKLTEPLTLEDAWKALHMAYPKMPRNMRDISALPLPSENCILILLATGRAFRLHYGEQCYYSHNNSVWFDVDDGFLCTKKDKQAPLELKEAFEQWKRNDRKGEILSNPAINVGPLPEPKPPKYHVHNNRNIIQGVLAGAALAGVIALFSVGLPIVIVTGIVTAFAYKTMRDRSELIACQKAHEIENSDIRAEPYSREEVESFWMGAVDVVTAQSKDPILNRWKNNQTHSNSSFYNAGKHLAEHLDKKSLNKLGRKIS